MVGDISRCTGRIQVLQAVLGCFFAKMFPIVHPFASVPGTRAAGLESGFERFCVLT